MKIKKIIFLSLLWLLSGQMHGWAATYYVATSGDPGRSCFYALRNFGCLSLSYGRLLQQNSLRNDKIGNLNTGDEKWVAMKPLRVPGRHEF